MSTEQALAGRTIVIYQDNPDGGGCYSVSVGNRRREQLTSDECLWTVACILMGKEPHYGLETREEIIEQTEKYVERRLRPEIRPFERLLK